MSGERARRVAVTEPLLADARPDYADAFEIELTHGDARTAEQYVRAGLEQAPAILRRIILTAHRRVLLLRLGPLDRPDRVLGWPITTASPDVVRLDASSPLVDAVIVGRRTAAGQLLLTTSLRFVRPVVMRVLWTGVGPLHRRIAPYLLRRAADPAGQARRPAAGGRRGGRVGA
jgi:hypothetical protein